MWNLWFSPKRRKADVEEKRCCCDQLLLISNSKASPINRYDGGKETKDDLDLLDKIPAFAMSLIAWIRTRRRRLVFLALCSPLLLFLLFAFFPILFAARIFLRLYRRRRRRLLEETEQILRSDRLDPNGETDELRCCDEDGGGEIRFLLERYLNDQLTLVLGFVYGYGEELREDDDEEEELRDIRASFNSSLGIGDLNFSSVNMESST